jgi:hypothetical protein
MNKKLLAISLLIFLAETGISLAIYRRGPVVYGNDCGGPVCCPPRVCRTRCYESNQRCCRGPIRCRPRWTLCCRRKKCCYPRVRCCKLPCPPQAEVVPYHEGYHHVSEVGPEYHHEHGMERNQEHRMEHQQDMAETEMTESEMPEEMADVEK